MITDIMDDVNPNDHDISDNDGRNKNAAESNKVSTIANDDVSVAPNSSSLQGDSGPTQASFNVLEEDEDTLTKDTEPISSQQGNESEEKPQREKGRCNIDWKSVGNKIKASWLKYHLLWLLILAVIIGTTWPLPGKTLGDARLGNGLCLVSINNTNGNSTPQEEQICVWSTISSLCVTIIFLVSGLQLKLDKMKRALMSPRSILIGYLLIFILTTSFGYAVAAGPKLNPPEFSFGLALFAIMPTTLSACIVIVGFAKGDTALALLLSVTTNLLGVAILPLTVTWMVSVFHSSSSSSSSSPSGTVRVNELDLCLSLVFTVLIPLVVGFGLRRYIRKVNELVEKFPITLKMISAFALASVPWMKISQSSSTFSQVDAAGYVVLIITGAALHIWFFVLCFIVSFVLLFYCSPRLPKASSSASSSSDGGPPKTKLNDTQLEDNLMEEKLRCLTLTGCQKTLPVALSVLELLPEDAVGGNVGLVALAIVLLQLMQTLMDSAIAIRWVDRNMTTTVINWFKLRPSSADTTAEQQDGVPVDV